MNFIDTQVKTPPITPPIEEWNLVFQDESRDIASEYRGGLGRYTNITAELDSVSLKDDTNFDFAGNMSESMLNAPVLHHQPLPGQAFGQSSLDPFQSSLPGMSSQAPDQHQRHGSTTSDSTFSSHTMGGVSSYSNGDQSLNSTGETRNILTDPQELLYMQVFVEEVGIWMDSMDGYKHVCIKIYLKARSNRRSFHVFCLSTPSQNQCYGTPS